MFKRFKKDNLGTVYIILLSTLVSNVGSYLVIPILGVFLVTERGLSTVEVGGIYANMVIAQTVGSLFGGVLADRLGAKRILLLGLLLRVIAFPLLFHAQAIWTTAAACMLIWFGSGVYVPTAKAGISALSDPANKPKWLALRSTYANVGVVTGPLLGLFFAPIFGQAVLFYAAAALFLLAAICNALIPEFQTSIAQPLGRYIRTFRDILRMPGAWMLVFIVFGFNACHALFGLVMPIFGKLHVAPSAPQITYIVNAIVVVTLQLTVATRIQLMRNGASLPVGFMTISLAAVLMSFSTQGVWLFGVAVGIYSIAEVLLLLKVDYIASNVGHNVLGATFAMSSMLGALGGAIGNQGFGALYEMFDPGKFWLWSALLAACLGLSILTFPKGLRKSATGVVEL
ncbi:Multidrug resistance protein MdtH [Pandoraea horticolens]|uniref:Multidrug resistance protein MdtH n=1 Tax=Pandoraea horticolens TaxID=2508298 RepID=A0A5E4ZCY0_9BURK|nr:MFS transporter [Pandoraea horticolens]VVE58896.1 Multidrug resistance protein MdtH [Pandoraea horticolens]